MSALDTQIGGGHYKGMKIQPMEYSMKNGLDACQHTAIKYISRFREKGGIQDLEKAKHCIDMLIEFERQRLNEVEQIGQRHTGYISWSPKEQFDQAYRVTDGMTFGLAIEAMRQGKRAARKGWNGVGLWLEYIPARGVDLAFIRMSYPVNSRAYPEGARVPWLASQTDMLADDWMILD